MTYKIEETDVFDRQQKLAYRLYEARIFNNKEGSASYDWYCAGRMIDWSESKISEYIQYVIVEH